MIVNKATSPYNERLVTEVCALCGGERGEDFHVFFEHLADDHGPEDLQRAPRSNRRADAREVLA